MWKTFLNNPSCYARPFLDFGKTRNAKEILMFSDASKNKLLGFGGICQKSWVFSPWDPKFIEEKDPSIEYLKLYAVVVTILNWLDCFRNERIILFCDNQAVVSMINKNTSCKNCLALIRILVLHSMESNTRVSANYIPSKVNKDADLLSRLRIQEFRNRNPDADPVMTKIPD